VETFTSWFRARWGIALLAVVQFLNAIGEAIPVAEVEASFVQTGLPRSLLPFLAATKILSGVVLLLPTTAPALGATARWKEWAFAGIAIDTIGAASTYVLAGQFAAFGLKMIPFALVGWVIAYRQHLRLTGALPSREETRLTRVARHALAVGVAGAAISEVLRLPAVMRSLALIEYPEHILRILAPAKLAAVVVLLWPRAPARLREWALAGLLCNFAGALYHVGLLAFEEGLVLVPDVPTLVVYTSLLVAASWNVGTTNRLVEDVK